MKQFEICEYYEEKSDLITYDEKLKTFNEKNRDSVKNIFDEYESFKVGLEKQINNSKEYIEVKSNAVEYKYICLVHYFNQNIKIMKNQIEKVEYFKGYAVAARIQLDEKHVFFMNPPIDNSILYNQEY